MKHAHFLKPLLHINFGMCKLGVKGFQASQNLTVDGLVEHDTWIDYRIDEL
jgi:hypothetical protein